MNWELIATIAFWVIIGAGFVVIVGEMIVAGLSRDSVMEGRDDVQQPLKARPEPLAIEAYVAPTYAPRPYIGLEDPDYTEPIRTWERQQGATYVSRSHNGVDLTS